MAIHQRPPGDAGCESICSDGGDCPIDLRPSPCQGPQLDPTSPVGASGARRGAEGDLIFSASGASTTRRTAPRKMWIKMGPARPPWRRAAPCTAPDAASWAWGSASCGGLGRARSRLRSPRRRLRARPTWSIAASSPRARINSGSAISRTSPTWAGFVDVAFVIDVFARRIVGWRCVPVDPAHRLRARCARASD